MSDIPVWDNSSIYTGFDDPHFLRDHKNLRKTIKNLAVHTQTPCGLGATDQADWTLKTFDNLNTINALAENLASYAHMVYSVNTADNQALTQIDRVEEALIPLSGILVNFRQTLGSFNKTPAALIKADKRLTPYKLQITEELFQLCHQMSAAEEILAADLGRSGGDAWGRLHGAVSSTLKAVWDPQTKETKTVVELRALASHPDRSIRQKAYELELEAWKTVQIPLAASLNGVKGTALTLGQRRGWKTALDNSCRQARLSPEALGAMIDAMKDSLPAFRNYLKDKALALGLPQMTFYDLFAPVGQDKTVWDYQKAQAFIVQKFAGFSPELAQFAQKAFDQNWIHARPQSGKVGGAYCTSLPLAKQPRVMSNFDGTFGELKTLAHELGHGYHFWVLREESSFKHDYPMTLAETASIFCETIIFEESLKAAKEEDKTFILEQQLQDVTQVIVDILSRFEFEKNLFEKRAQGELSPEELCELMKAAQISTYGEGLDEKNLHPYMWAVKGHYYSPSLGFYNFPYAFGQLFSYALYGLYQKEGTPFIKKYDKLLSETGIKTADELARGLGFNLSQKEFWQQGLQVVLSQMKQFHETVKGRKNER